jgi:hypothetical protein
MNGVGPQGAGYTGTGVTGQDVLIYGNLLVTGGIDPTYLALTPQTSVPSGFINPLWVDSGNSNALRSENIYLKNSSVNNSSISMIPNNTNQIILSDGNTAETRNLMNYSSMTISDGTSTTSIDKNTINIGFNGSSYTGTLNCSTINGTVVTNATNVVVTDVSNNAIYYPTFVGSTGNQPLRADIGFTAFTFNPGRGELTASKFIGDLSGNFSGTITNAVTSSNAFITDVTNNATYYPVFVDGSGNKPLRADISTGPLTYNPSTGFLSATRFIGDVSSNNIIANRLALQSSSTNFNFNVPFTDATTTTPGILYTLGSTFFTYNPSTAVLTVRSINAFNSISSGNATVTGTVTATNFSGTATRASNVNITDTSINVIYYPTFVGSTGFQPVRADISSGPFTYNPSTGTLSTTTFSGDLSGNILTTPSSANATFYPTFVSGVTGNNRINANTNLSYNPSTSIMNFSAPPTCSIGASGANQLANWNNFQQTSFIPTLISSGGGTCTYTTQTGRYIKMFNLCIFSAEIQISSSSLFTGDLSVSLPIANSSNSSSSFDIGLCDNMAVDCVSHVLSCAVNATAASINFKTSAAPGTVYTPVTDTDISTTSFIIRYGGSYVCAT